MRTFLMEPTSRLRFCAARFVDTPRAALKTDPGLGHLGSRQGTYGADA
jgi:hypothetical protein